MPFYALYIQILIPPEDSGRASIAALWVLDLNQCSIGYPYILQRPEGVAACLMIIHTVCNFHQVKKKSTLPWKTIIILTFN